MKWHLFNPEHDLALANGTRGFTPPAAGRGIRHGLGFLPAFWASTGDRVLVEDKKLAQERAREFEAWLPAVTFVSMAECPAISKQDAEQVDVWGWDAAVRWQLEKLGFPQEILPAESDVAAVRRLSHRETSVEILQSLVAEQDFLVGQRVCVHTIDEVRQCLRDWENIVVKAPWSSSGRGVRFFSHGMSDGEEHYVSHVLKRQGAVIVEPCYDRVMDLAVEWTADGQGMLTYEGLSLFATDGGAYTGNLLLNEERKWLMLSELIDTDWLSDTIKRLEPMLVALTKGQYAGPLGVDMMVVSTGHGLSLHPCVEINLRRTMGHVALAIARRTDYRFHEMCVVPKDNYRLQLLETPKTKDNQLQNIIKKNK